MNTRDDTKFSTQEIARVDDVVERLPATVSEYHSFVQDLTMLVNEGHTSPLRVLSMLKTMANLYDDVKDAIMSACLHDYERHREKGNVVSFGMYEIKEENVGVRYDYSNDRYWASLKEEIERLKELHGITALEQRLKAREELLRNVGKGNGGVVYDVDEVTGEEYLRCAPLIVSGKNALKFHRKKKD